MGILQVCPLRTGDMPDIHLKPRLGGVCLLGGCRGLAQQAVQLVFQRQFLFLQGFDLVMGGMFDMRFQILDLLVQIVVLVEDVEEMAVGGFQLRDQVAVFWKHRRSRQG